MAVVGLDFGCLNAVMAQAERGGVTVLLNENSKRLNANLVSFQGKQRFLGAARRPSGSGLLPSRAGASFRCLARLERRVVL